MRCVHLAVESLAAGTVGEDKWVEHTATALRSLNARREWNGPAVLVLPAHLTLTKQIKVPRVEPARRTQIIRFEAEQAIPHAPAEMVWDSVDSGRRDTEEEVMVVAAKREIVDQLCLAVAAAGFEPARILPSALATLAAFRLAQPKLAQPVLILNLGERSTTLLQVEGARFAARTLVLGGTNVTQQPGENKESEPGEANHSLVARLDQEISRTVQHFAREGGLANPLQIFLTGSGARLAGFAEALTVRLGIPVEHFDAQSAVEFNPGFASVETVPGALTDLIGAAAIALLPDQPALNLLPPALRQRASLRRRQPWLIAAALLAMAALVPPILHYRQVAAAVRTKLSAMEKALVPLRAREVRIRTDLAQLQQLKVRVAHLQSVHERRTAWLHLFAGLQEQLIKGEDVWLEKMKLIPPEVGGSLKSAVSGCMLDRTSYAAHGSTETNHRSKSLLAGIASMPEVAAIESERIDHSQPGLLRFDFILVRNPAHPL